MSTYLGTQSESVALKAIWKSMSRRRRGHFFSVMGVMLLGTFAELATIGAVLPFLALVSDPQRARQIPGFRQITGLIDSFSSMNPILLATMLLIVSAVAATIIRLLLNWATLNFVLLLSHEVGTKIFSRMLRQPYEYYLSRNTSELLSSVEKVSTVVWGVLMPGMQGISSAIMSVSIIILLVVIDPFTATVVATTIGIAYFLVSIGVRTRLHANSEQLARAATARIQTMQEGMGGIRDVRLEQSQATFENKFRKIDYSYRRAQAINNFISLAPRFVVEGVGIVAIAVLAFYASKQPGGVVAAIPVLGALAIGAQRLLPLLQQAYVAWSSHAGNREVLNDVVALMNAPVVATGRRSSDRPSQPFKRDIQLVDVGFRYGGRDHALQDINLVIPKGTSVGFIAETGGGKSTLFDVIMALIQPTTGAVLIDGKALSPANCADWQAQIAHVPQAIFLADGSIAANIAFGSAEDEIDMPRIRQAAKQAHIDAFISQLSDGYDTMVGERGVRLSGGQRQRIGIARALYKKAPVLILDEATSALDDETEAAIMKSILKLGDRITLLMIAHRLTTLRECDQIVRLENGQIEGIGSFNAMVGAREGSS